MDEINSNYQLQITDASLALDSQNVYFLPPQVQYAHINDANFSEPHTASTSNILNLTPLDLISHDTQSEEQINVDTTVNTIIPASSTNQNIIPPTNAVESSDIFENVEIKNRLETLKSDLKNLIYQDPRGKEILTGFHNTKQLNRSTLTYILVDSVVNPTHPDTRINKTKFMEWAYDIIKLFPSELLTTWYKPYKKPTEKSKKKTAGGCLYNAYIAKREKYRTIKLLQRKRVQVIQQSNSLSLPNIDVEPDVIWLKHNNAPWDEVLLRWRGTNILREKQYDYSIETYFNTFPCLKVANGYNLLYCLLII